MNELLIILLFLVIGYISGVLIGMLGIGGGLIFVPVLFYLLPIINIPETNLSYYTVGTSLFAGSMGTSVSAYLHNRIKNFMKHPAILVSIGAALAAFITPFFVIKIQSQLVELVFAAVLFLVTFRLFFENKIKRLYFTTVPINTKFYIPLGILVGLFSAFTGLGGGIIYVPALIYFFHIDTKISVGTSSIIVAITMISSTIAYLFQTSGVEALPGTIGFVDIQAALPLGIGSIFGAFSGVRFALKSTVKLLRNVFAVVLIFAIATILFRIG
ncbi:MAG: sulfite exporter TauE/SafE family protein [Ignavibacteria bacterium]|nr:sulfite exporter TauE/SafE family protein [Ignavibacteria bacterium]